MSLFDDFQRSDTRPASFSEPQFTYLNHSNRPIMAAVRKLLDEWFSRYPDRERPEMRRRIRDTNDIEHTSAVFELFLHELLLRLGCKVEVHPMLSRTLKHPDFLVQSPTGQKYYLEAIVVTDQSAEQKAAKARMNVLHDVLNRLDSPNFFIGMDIKGSPKSPPPANKIKRFLERQLASLDPDEVTAANAHQYRWPFTHDGLAVEFFPIPKSPESRGKEGLRPMGMQILGLDEWTPEEAIKEAVVKKAARYGEVDLPYVIAVNTLNSVDRQDVLEGLFGEQLLVRSMLDSGPGPWRHTRVPNGAWTSPSGPRYTRVNAVLLVNGRLFSHGTFRDDSCLYHNPGAHPYSLELTRLTQAISLDGQMEWRDGESARALLNIPSD